jgi:hypothetical protein
MFETATQTLATATPPTTQPRVPTRWVDSLETLLGSLGPRRWEDVEDAVDHVLTGIPLIPPTFTGGRPQERALSGYESAHRLVLAGLESVPPKVALRWARLSMSIREPFAKTMVPIGHGVVEALLDELADTFDAPGRHVPLDLTVLESMAAELGLGESAVLLSAFQLGPETLDAAPSRACLTLTALHGYEEALTRHAAVMRTHILAFDPQGQCRSAQMLGRASTTTLRVYAAVIDAMAESRDPAVRAATRLLVQRRDASRPAVSTASLMNPSWQRLGQRLDHVPTPRVSPFDRLPSRRP